MNNEANNAAAVKYLLCDTFNKRIISTHRTISAAVKAERRFGLAVQRKNGSGSYIPTTIRVLEPSSQPRSTSSLYERARTMTDDEVSEYDRCAP